MPLAAAGIAAGGSILGGITGGKGAKSAARIQANAYQQGINEQAREFNQTQTNMQPAINAGNSSIQQILRLLGLGDSNAGISVDGNPAQSASQQQAAALAGITSSPLYTGAYQNGVDTILANQAATGGLRGGNTQNSLAQFGSGLYSDVYQNDLSNLLALAGIGTNQASSLGTIGQNNASATSTLLGQQGGANASGVLGQANSLQNTLNSLSGIAGKYFNSTASDVWNGSGAYPSSAYGW